MSIIKFFEGKKERLNIWNMAAIKVLLIFIGIIIGAYISTFVISSVVYIIIICVLLYLYIAKSMFSK
jgi:hypothetical protein